MSSDRDDYDYERYGEPDEDHCPRYDLEDEEDLVDGVGFADPGGTSALRAATASNPRIYPCPNCDSPNRLTRLDVERGYQCDTCADALENGWGY